jgi:hypothetical protein
MQAASAKNLLNFQSLNGKEIPNSIVYRFVGLSQGLSLTRSWHNNLSKTTLTNPLKPLHTRFITTFRNEFSAQSVRKFDRNSNLRFPNNYVQLISRTKTH